MAKVPSPNVLTELPATRNASVVVAEVAAVDIESARGKAPNNQLKASDLLLTARIGPWLLSKQALSVLRVIHKGTNRSFQQGGSLVFRACPYFSIKFIKSGSCTHFLLIHWPNL